MELYTNIRASASSEELIRKLCAVMKEDIPKLARIQMGFYNPTKKNHLNSIWYGMNAYAEHLNPPEGYYSYSGTKTVDWEKCMKVYAEILGENGFVLISFTNSVSPDYSVDMGTMPDGSIFVCESNDRSTWKKVSEAFASHQDAYKAVYIEQFSRYLFD